MTFVLLSFSRIFYLFCGNLSSLNSNCGVGTVNGLNSGNSCGVIAGINNYFLNGGNYCVSINGLSLLAAIAGNHSNAEQNSERQNYFLHFFEN